MNKHNLKFDSRRKCLVFDNLAELEDVEMVNGEMPAAGDPSRLYINTASGALYRWDGTQFVQLGVARYLDLPDRPTGQPGNLASFDELGELADSNFPLGALEQIIEKLCHHVWTVSAGVSTGGSVSIPEEYRQTFVGNTVKFSVSPDPGHQLVSIEATTLDSNRNTTHQEVELTDLGGGLYSMVMPYADVEILASFEQPQYAIARSIDSGSGTVAGPVTGLEGDEVEFEITAAAGCEFHNLDDVTVINDTTGETVGFDGGENILRFTMPASSVTIHVSFHQLPDWAPLTFAGSFPDLQNGTLILASEADNMMATGNLANYRIECSAAGISNRKISAANASLAKKFAIGNRTMVDSGPYSGKYAYTLSYVNGSGETKYLTYSASGLSNGTTVNNNARWFLGKEDGDIVLVNIGSTTTRLYYHDGVVKQLTASDHSQRPEGYHLLTPFVEELTGTGQTGNENLAG